jgi:flagellar biogenesis protein FliO
MIVPIAEPSPGNFAASRDSWRSLRAWWARILRVTHHAPRQLRLAESLSMGDRRFVAVVEYEQLRFLIGGTPASLVLLARWGENDAVPLAATEPDLKSAEEKS